MTATPLFYIIYKTTNIINGKIYIGQHITKDIDDNYIGSGRLLKREITKYGRANFKREILHTFDNYADMNDKEMELVNKEFILRDDVYNVRLGGRCADFENTIFGTVVVVDEHGTRILCKKTDPKYIDGTYKHHLTGRVTIINEFGNTVSINSSDKTADMKTPTSGHLTCKDTYGKLVRVRCNDPRYISGELIPWCTDRIIAYDTMDDRLVMVDKDDVRFTTGLLRLDYNGGAHPSAGKTVVFDETGNRIKISVDDARYVSGELKHHLAGICVLGGPHTDSTKQKMAEKKCGSNNPWFGAVYIHNDDTKESIRVVSGSTEYDIKLANGWKIGRKYYDKCWMHNVSLSKIQMVNTCDVVALTKSGWNLGRGGRSSERPSSEQLQIDINSMAWLDVGQKYGVSVNAVRKWCRAYGITKKFD